MGRICRTSPAALMSIRINRPENVGFGARLAEDPASVAPCKTPASGVETPAGAPAQSRDRLALPVLRRGPPRILRSRAMSSPARSSDRGSSRYLAPRGRLLWPAVTMFTPEVIARTVPGVFRVAAETVQRHIPLLPSLRCASSVFSFSCVLGSRNNSPVE